MSRLKDKIREIFDQTVESEISYKGNLKKIDFYSLVCNAASKNCLHTVLGSNLCMFNFDFNEKESILMLFSIPMNSSDESGKHIAERSMDIIRTLEECFTFLDSLNLVESKEDKFMYLIAVKELEEKDG